MMRLQLTYVCAALVTMACGGPSRAEPAKANPPAQAGIAADTGHSDLIAARTMGAATAPITVYEMSDFQCPWCRKQATETFPIIEREYIATGKVRWVFLNLPLTSLHPNAAAAAEFGMCGARAGKFWPIHDLLFKYQDTWAPLKEPGAFLITLADSVGMPRADMLKCLQDPETRRLVQADAEGAARSGAKSTPSVYIEGGIMAGAAPIEVFRQVLDSIYRVKTKK